MSDQAREGDGEPHAFVAIKTDDRAWVEDLTTGESWIGGAPDCAVELPGTTGRHACMVWDGRTLVVRPGEAQALSYVNGKKLAGSAELKPGDEMTIGSAQLVFGMAMPMSPGGRRALTHHEFRERLYEELPRAARRGQPAALVMLQARAGEGSKIAAAALDHFRAGDVLGAYSHDELELLLPDTEGAVARGVVERLLVAAEVATTVGGLAVFPSDGDHPERLLRAARCALRAAKDKGGGLALPPPRVPTATELYARDGASRAIAEQLQQLAQTTGNALVTGEIGSGKALFARAVHERSTRTGASLVVMRCGLVQEEELQVARERQSVEQAKGGTLVLEDVGDLDPAAQPALLEQLQARKDVRVIGTTHRALAGLVERNGFDRALYELLSEHSVELPPLRNRVADVIPLAERFAVEAGARSPVPFSAGALARLRSYPWPGNLLELRNAMERAARLANGGEILAEHLPSEVLPMGSGEGRLREHVDSVERDAIVKALADSNHNQTHAARQLGISRRALIYKMEKYGLKPPPGTARRSN